MTRLSDLFNIILEYDVKASYKVYNAVINDPVVAGVFTDSREVKAGSIFICISGNSCDGHAYINEAIKNGAVAFITDRNIDVQLPYILVENVRNMIGIISSVVYGYPSSKLLMCGITGTNGKSTTAFMIRHILEAEGVKTGILGTIIYDDGSFAEEASRTTPEGSYVQRYLSRMLQNGCRACVMEVSSHGLSLGRLNGCQFNGSIFTNLSEEHLDFHGDIQTYFLAKETLFRSFMKPSWVGVANGDDFYGRILYTKYSNNISLYGMSNDKYKYEATKILYGKNTTRFTLVYSGRNYEVVIPYMGKYNVYNALSAISLANALGIDIEASLSCLKYAPRVPGRFESYYLNNGVRVVIDFAHTPFALKNLLASIRELSRGRIISVFGHGGDRFSENRPQLGKIAASFADKIIITSDNPRSEDPCLIADQIYRGSVVSNPDKNVSIILDRKEAVFTALSDARDGDIVVISGKGPEREIVYENHRIPYNDLDAMVSWTQTTGVKIL